MSFLLDALFPEGAVCLVCGCLSHGDLLCHECRWDLKRERMPECVCPRCGKPEKAGRACGCDLPERVTARSAWYYGGPAAKLVQTLKFNQVSSAHDVLAGGMAETLDALSLTGQVMVTWVTMPPSRWRERSFDHAQLLAECMADRLGLPCTRLIERIEKDGDLTHQVGLNAAERAENLKGSFRCDQPLSGTVVLVDDVYTTGSTIRSAAQCLLDAGAEQVAAITACRAVKD